MSAKLVDAWYDMERGIYLSSRPRYTSRAGDGFKPCARKYCIDKVCGTHTFSSEKARRLWMTNAPINIRVEWSDNGWADVNPFFRSAASWDRMWARHLELADDDRYKHGVWPR